MERGRREIEMERGRREIEKGIGHMINNILSYIHTIYVALHIHVHFKHTVHVPSL